MIELRRICAGNGLRRHCFACELLLREALNNAVVHGSRRMQKCPFVARCG